MAYTLEELLRAMVDKGGSDLHITAGSPPRMRIDGKLRAMEDGNYTPQMSQDMIYALLDSEQIAKFEKTFELDMSFGMKGIGRFRTNVFYQRGAVGAVLRIIPYEIMPFEKLGISPEVCRNIANLPHGLILVTGATGSGKSTTLASIIDYINQTHEGHIVTIEDPIEFVHKNKKCLINQREVGADTHGFGPALKHILRQDPDVVLIGEMRDMETIEAGLTLAETGHLTFATLHTSDCVQTINRIVDVFPSNQQQQIRTQLSFVLEGVLCQQLLPISNGKGRALAAEIMLATPAIRALIRDDKAHQIQSSIQTGQKDGMITMNKSLFKLYSEGKITYDLALSRSGDTEDLKLTFDRGNNA